MSITLIAQLAIPSLASAQVAPGAIFISDEVFAPNTGSSCSGQSASSAAGIALRAAVSAQDDAWRAATAVDGATSYVLVDPPTPTNQNYVDSHPTDFAVPGAALTVSVSKRDISPAVRDSLLANFFRHVGSCQLPRSVHTSIRHIRVGIDAAGLLSSPN